MPVKNRIQIRRGTTEQWNETTDILSDGEIGFDSSQYNIKIGDGSSTWTELDWLVDLSGQIVSNTGIFDVIEFNTDPPVVPVEGQLVWSNTYGTLSLGLEGDHIFHIGQETNFRVRNQTGDNLYKGQPVAATGVHSDNIRLRVNKYAADASLREVRFIGLISEDIANNESGFSTNFGYVRGNTTSILDTRGNVESAIAVGDETWVQGDILYVHPTVAGKLTKVEPKHSISVAIVIRVHQEQGVLLVRPTSYGHLNDNHDVSVSGATNGQFLQYNSATDYWIPSSSGNFSTLLVNGTGVSVSGHTHTSSNITNFNSSVSGLLSVTSISAGSGIAVSSSSGNHTVSVNIIDCGIIGSGYTPPVIGQTLPFSVVLTSGVNYSIPANCSSMKVWVIGGGGNGGDPGGDLYPGQQCAGGGGGAGGCAYKTWSNPVGSVSMSIGGPTQATSLSYSSQTITGNAGSNGQDGMYDSWIESQYNGQGGNGGSYSGGDGGANGSRGYGRSFWTCTSNGEGGGGIGGAYTGTTTQTTTQSTTGQSASDISGLLAALTAAGASVPFNTTLSAGTNASTFGGGGAGGSSSSTNGGNGYFGGGGGGASYLGNKGNGGSGVVVISFS